MTTVEQLDDSNAVRILDTLRQHALNAEESVTECPTELREALQAEFGAPTDLPDQLEDSSPLPCRCEETPPPVCGHACVTP